MVHKKKRKSVCRRNHVCMRRPADYGEILVIDMDWRNLKALADRYLVNFAVLILAWGGMLRRSFNCDTLTHMWFTREDIGWMMEHGRYLSAFQDWLLYQLGVSTATHTGITVLAEIVLLALSVCIVQTCFEEKIGRPAGMGSKLAWISLTGLLFSNVLFAESFMFGGCALMFGMAYFLATIGIWFFTKKKYVWALLFFLLSTAEYQAAVIYAVIVLSTWIFIESECAITAKTVRQEFLCGCMTVGSGVLNIFSLKLASMVGLVEKAERSIGYRDLLGNARKCLEDFGKILLNSKGLFHKVWLPLIVLCIAAGITLWHLGKERKWNAIVYYVLLVIALFMMVYILPMVQYAQTYPRFVWTFYAAQAMLLLIAFWRMPGKGKEAMCYLSGGYLLIHILFCNIIVSNHMTSNTLDKTYTMMVYEKILEYEEETGKRVEKLAVAKDLNCPFTYDNVYYKTDQINERALGTVTNTLVNIVTGREFEKVPMDEKVFRTYFEGKDWNYFDASEQLVIIEDTAYWVIF